MSTTVVDAGPDPRIPWLYRAAIMERGRVVAYHSGMTPAQARRFAECSLTPAPTVPPSGLWKGPEDA